MSLLLMILIQGMSVLFAVVSAKHDAPAVDKFEFYGVTKNEMDVFHKWNLLLKLCFCIISGLAFQGLEMLFGFALSGLWIWLVFDPVLNLSRARKKPWHYIGENDADGRRWIKWFNGSAGEMKALLLLILIAGVNFTYLKLFV